MFHASPVSFVTPPIAQDSGSYSILWDKVANMVDYGVEIPQI